MRNSRITVIYLALSIILIFATFFLSLDIDTPYSIVGVILGALSEYGPFIPINLTIFINTLEVFAIIFLAISTRLAYKEKSWKSRKSGNINTRTFSFIAIISIIFCIIELIVDLTFTSISLGIIPLIIARLFLLINSTSLIIIGVMYYKEL